MEGLAGLAEESTKERTQAEDETQEKEDKTFEYKDDKIILNVILPWDSSVPDDASLKAEQITEKNSNYSELIKKTEDLISEKTKDEIFYSIDFYTKDNEYIEVKDDARVYVKLLNSDISGDNFAVVHFKDEDNTVEIKPDSVEKDKNKNLSQIEFSTEGFSDFAILSLDSSTTDDSETESEATADMYVKSVHVNLGSSGTGPFDDNDDDGNDSSADNDIVRSFDLATYNISVDMESLTSSYHDYAKVWVEINLDGTDTENKFNEESFKWLDYYEIVPSSDGKSKTLRGYYEAEKSESSTHVVPGNIDNMTVGVQTLAMEDGTILKPTGKIWLEDKDGNTSEKKDLEFPPLEISAKLQLNVHLEATPAAFTSVEGTFDFSDAKSSDYFNSDKGEVTGVLFNYGIVVQMYNTENGKGMKGQALPDGDDITLTLNFGSKYQVDRNASTSYANQKVDLGEFDNGTYQLLFYSLEGNQANDEQSDGRKLENSEGESVNEKYSRYVPYNNRNYDNNAEKTCVEDGGTWTPVSMDDSSSVTSMTVKISNYQITDLVFPYARPANSSVNYWYNAGTPVQDIDKACFSAGELWVLQPFVYTDSNGVKHDIESDLGAGTFTINMNDGEIDSEVGKYVTGSYNSYTAERDENGNLTGKTSDTATTKQINVQEYDKDDANSQTHYIAPPGYFNNKINYTNGSSAWLNVQNNSNIYDGKDYAFWGEDKIGIAGGWQYTEAGIENRAAASNVMIKFDAAALELDDGQTYSHPNCVGMKGEDVKVFYGYLPDGENWDSDDEMQAADEDDLVWYSEEQENKTCVSVLFEYRTPSTTTSMTYLFPMLLMHVLTKPEIENKVFMTCEVTRLWNSSDIANAYNKSHPGEHISAADVNAASKDKYTSAVLKSAADDYYTSLKSGKLTVNHSTETLLAQCKGYGSGGEYYTHTTGTKYEKVVYAADGTSTGHNSRYNFGDSLLILGYTSNVTKNVCQISNNLDENGNIIDTETKDSYLLQRSERIADYVLTGNFVTSNNTEIKSDMTTTVTFVDTLPAGMKYLIDSAYVGTVDKDGNFSVKYNLSDVAGQHGSVSNGEKFTQVVNKDGLTDENIDAAMLVENNDDGTSKITFVVRNVPIQSGDTVKVYYSVFLGDESNAQNDLKNGASLVNTVSIQTTEDNTRELTTVNGNVDTNTIFIIKLYEHSFSKYAVREINEVNEDPAWVVTWTNHDNSSYAMMMLEDAMPYSGDSRGSSYDGSYTISKWSLDLSYIDKDSAKNLTLYYTTDSSYAGKTLSLTGSDGGIKWDDITANWNTLPLTVDEDNNTVTADFSGVYTYDSDGNQTNFVYSWALGGSVANGDSAVVTVAVHQDDARANDQMTNSASYSSGTDVFKREASIYRIARNVSGTVWLDENMDGGIDGTEKHISGADVILQTEDENGNWVTASDLFGNLCETTTNSNGYYQFKNLPDGKFRIVFKDGSDMNYKLSNNILTKYMADGIAGSVNSKATEDSTGTYEGLIDNIELPSTDNMTVKEYNLDYQNAGYTKTSSITIRKIGENIYGTDITDSKTDGLVTVYLYSNDESNKDPIKTLTIDSSSNWSVTISGLPYYDGSGNQIDYTAYYVDEDKVSGYQKGVEAIQGSDGIYSVNVTNRAGFELPSSGGKGIIPLYILGSLFLLSAVAVTIQKFRMKRNA